MSAEDSPAVARPSRPVVILEISIAAIFTAAAGYIALAMPSLVEQGGMEEAQEFLHLSPVFFPELSFGLTCLVSAIFLVQAARRLPSAISAGPIEPARYVHVAIMSALVVAYGSLLPWLGFGFTTLLMVGATTYFLGLRSWWKLALFSIVTPIVIRFVFERLLYISLPLSPIEFLTNVEQGVMKLLAGLLLRS